MDPYYSVIIPYVSDEHRTIWHPTEITGPLSSLSRGVFKTQSQAIQWGKDNLKGNPYTIVLVK